jgi:adenylate kinase
MAAKLPSPGRKPRRGRAPGTIPKAVSSFATGDAGGRYQDRVDGWLLAQLLLRGGLPGVPGTIVKAAFQRRVHGALLDDAVVLTDAAIEVQLSIKMGVSVTEHDPDFRDLLMLAWAAQSAGQWTGLVLPPHAPGLQTLRTLVFLAKENDSVADFVTRTTTPGVLAERDRVLACRNILEAAAGAPITDAQFHAFLRQFTVVALDFDVPPHQDEQTVVATLASERGIPHAAARTLYATLVEIGVDLAIAAAGVDYPGLERRLRARNVVAGLAPDLRPLRAALTSCADRTFESGSAAVAGVHLDRTELVATVDAELVGGNVALVTGEPGVGKSTLIRSVVERLAAEGPVLHLSGRRIENAGSWSALATEVGLPKDRDRLGELLATHPRGVVVVLDALEHVISRQARTAVNDLLHDLRKLDVPLNVVLGVRESALPNIGWLDTTKLPPVRQVSVSGLSPADAAQIAAASPVLGELIARSPKPFPGGLKLLALLHDTRIVDAELANTPATESDLLDLWWRTVLVGDSDMGHDRFRVVLAAAESVVEQPSGFFELPLTAPGTIIGGLIRDGILVHDTTIDRYRFGHDIIQDWAIVHWLSTAAGDPVARVRHVLAMPGYYRAVSLYSQRLAERDPARYATLRAVTLGSADQHGATAFRTALVLSPRATALLAAHCDELLANDGVELAALLHIIEAEQITLSVALVDEFRREGSSAAEATALAAALALPRWRVWAPLIGFCLENIGGIGAAYYPFLKVAERWQRSTPSRARFRRAIMDQAIRVLAFFEGWRPHQVGDVGPKIARDDWDAAEKLARKIVALSTDVDAAYVKTYLTDLLEKGHGDDQDDMLGNLPALAADLPDEVVAFGSRVLKSPDVAPWELDMEYVGVRNHLYFPTSDWQGPFLGILRTNEAAGLELVRALARRAVDKYAQRWRKRGAQLRPLTFTFAGRSITVLGDYRAYTWFRPGAHDSSVLTSGLMAVDTWAFDAIAAGRPPREIVELLLAGDPPLPFIGIAVGLAYDYPEVVRVLAELLSQPWIWRFEEYRRRLDAAPGLDDVLPMEMELPAYKPHFAERNRARDARRQQTRLPMRFAVDLLFNPAVGGARDAFVAAARAKTLVDAAVFVDEATLVVTDPGSDHLDETRADFATFQRMTNPDCYEVHADGSVQLRTLPMDQEAQLAQRIAQTVASMHQADLIANKALRDYVPPASPAAFASVGQRFAELHGWDRIVGADRATAEAASLRCACVAVTFMPYAGMEPSTWAAEYVREAAQRYDAERWDEEREDADLMDIRVSVATGLGALFAAHPDDEPLRTLVFRLAARATLLDVANGLMRGMLPLWEQRPSAPATVLSLMLEAALSDDEHVDAAAIGAAEADERAGLARPWPVLTTPSHPAVYRLAKILTAGLPRRITDSRAIALFVPLLDALFDVSDGGDDDGVWLSLDNAIARLAANVAVGIVSGYEGFRVRLADWRRSPKTYAHIVANVVRAHFSETEIDAGAALFAALAEPFLRADHGAAVAGAYLERDFRDACWALIMIADFEGVLVPQEWPYPGRFTNHIGRWIDAVGGHPTNASALLAFLERFPDAFAASQVIAWLSALVARTSSMHRSTLWREQGTSIAVLLLRLVTDRPTELKDAETHRRVAVLADQLLEQGVAGAGELRDGLERLNRP